MRYIPSKHFLTPVVKVGLPKDESTDSYGAHAYVVGTYSHNLGLVIATSGYHDCRTVPSVPGSKFFSISILEDKLINPILAVFIYPS